MPRVYLLMENRPLQLMGQESPSICLRIDFNIMTSSLSSPLTVDSRWHSGPLSTFCSCGSLWMFFIPTLGPIGHNECQCPVASPTEPGEDCSIINLNSVSPNVSQHCKTKKINYRYWIYTHTSYIQWSLNAHWEMTHLLNKPVWVSYSYSQNYYGLDSLGYSWQ